MWRLRTNTLPVIVRVLDIIKNGTDKHMNKISGSSSQYEIQKIALCRTLADPLKKVLSMRLKIITQKRQQKLIHINTFPHARSWIKTRSRIVRNRK